MFGKDKRRISKSKKEADRKKKIFKPVEKLDEKNRKLRIRLQHVQNQPPMPSITSAKAKAKKQQDAKARHKKGRK